MLLLGERCMVKYNVKPSVENTVMNHPDRVSNYEGGVAFKTSEKNELYLRCATWLVAEPKFYGDTVTETSAIEALIASISEADPEFVPRLAAYLRNEMYLRSAPQFLMVEALKNKASRALIRKWVPSIVARADEITEALSIFIAKNGQIGKSGKGSLPRQFKLGLGDSFYNFTEYQFAKYKMDDKAVKLSDAIRVIHPKPRSVTESELYKRIRTNTLKIPETWETVISAKGNNKDAWNEVISQMGYMAKLRNLRNIANADADLESVLTHLTSEKAVRNSKQFPFRFYSAWKMMDELNDPFKADKIRRALEKAMELSVANIPHLKGRTLVSADVSGSMQSPISERSKVQRIEVACIMTAMAGGFSDMGLSSVFGTDFVPVPVIGHIIADAQRFMSTSTNGMSTNGYKVFEYLEVKRIPVDRVMIFTDCQLWDSTGRTYWGSGDQSLYQHYLTYKRSVNPNVKLYLFDLAGYGTVQIPDNEPNVVNIGGWSDRVFEFIKFFEEDKTKALAMVERYAPLTKNDENDADEGSQ